MRSLNMDRNLQFKFTCHKEFWLPRTISFVCPSTSNIGQCNRSFVYIDTDKETINLLQEHFSFVLP